MLYHDKEVLNKGLYCVNDNWSYKVLLVTVRLLDSRVVRVLVVSNYQGHRMMGEANYQGWEERDNEGSKERLPVTGVDTMREQNTNYWQQVGH